MPSTIKMIIIIIKLYHRYFQNMNEILRVTIIYHDENDIIHYVIFPPNLCLLVLKVIKINKSDVKKKP